MSEQFDPAASSAPKRPGGKMKTNQEGAPSRSQLVPFATDWHEITSKPYFVPGVLLCVVIALLFTFLGRRDATFTVQLYGILPVGVPMYTIVLALLISGGSAYAVYRMAGKPKAWWMMPAVAVFTGVLVYSPVMPMLQNLFGLGGGDPTANDGVIVSFIKMFFAAGLPEETLKAIPVAIGVFVGWKMLNRVGPNHPARQFAVIEPLDGILIGVAAGLGFAFAETIFLYVPRIIVKSPQVVAGLLLELKQLGYTVKIPQDVSLMQLIVSLYVALVKKIGLTRAAFELQQIISSRLSIGLELMIPRLLSDLTGHAAYAGIFGYFIGLAAMKPVQRVKTVLVGLLVAATIHALWDSLPGGTLTYFLLALLAFGGLAITISKARAISPQRSQLVASQLIDRFARSSTVGAHGAPTAAPTAAVEPGGRYRKATAPAQSMTWDDGGGHGTLEIGSLRVPVAVGAVLLERQLAGAESQRGDGVVAEVSANPNDPSMLGLKNLSRADWRVETAEGETRDLAPGRSIRLARGMRMRIGTSDVYVR